MHQLNLSFFKAFRVVAQVERSDCGLACIAMIASHFGLEVDVRAMRQRNPPSVRGMSLQSLVGLAAQYELTLRPLKVREESVNLLKLPCILHWDFNHFVVLQKVSRSKAVIVDPARGLLTISRSDFAQRFTGIALEAFPTPSFRPEKSVNGARAGRVLSRIQGLSAGIGQIFLFSLVFELFSLIAPLFAQLAFDRGIGGGESEIIVPLMLGFTFLLLLQIVTGALRSWVVVFLTTQLGIQWQSMAFRHLMKLPLGYFEKRQSGEVMSRFSSVNVIKATLGSAFVETMVDGVLATITFGVMLYYSAMLTAISVVSLVLYAVARAFVGPRQSRATRSFAERSGNQQSAFLESIRGAATFKLFSQEDNRHSTWLNKVIDSTNAQVALSRVSVIFQSIRALIGGCEYILVVGLGAAFVMRGTLSVGMLITFIAYRATFSARVVALVDKIVDFALLRVHLERLSDIVDNEVEDLDSHPRGCAYTDGLSISLSNVSFRYSETDTWVIRNLNAAFEANRSTAVVGPSGCGKSTLVKIIVGLANVSEGRIIVNGRPLSEINLKDYRNAVGVVLQEDMLFSGSLRSNIALFDNDVVDDEWVRECAEVAQIHNDIMRMPMQYETAVGDLGSSLSSGQKQRIILARALYKRPKLLILDEATSHLDVITERRVSDAIARLCITRILVAHRPETIASADSILSLSGPLDEENRPKVAQS